MRTILLVESDTHAGHLLGLMNPEVELMKDNKGVLSPYHPELTETQKWLWGLRESNLTRASEIANGDPIYYFHNGDPTHGTAHPEQLDSTAMGDQILIAIENAKPILKLPNLCGVIYTVGTPVHNFGEASSDILITKHLSAFAPSLDIRLFYHGLVNLNGITIDFAHHGPGPGTRKWLEGNVASYYLRDHMIKELLAGKTPPMIYLRSHFHTYTHVVWNVTVKCQEFTSHLIITPPMCLPGDFARKVTQSVYSVSPGLIAIEIIDGRIMQIHPLLESLDLRTIEVL